MSITAYTPVVITAEELATGAGVPKEEFQRMVIAELERMCRHTDELYLRYSRYSVALREYWRPLISNRGMSRKLQRRHGRRTR